MAGKPELSVAQQTQAQGLQNVVVYVSNDNITHTYATAVGHPNGVTYDGAPQSVTQLQKNFVSKALKTNECQQANGVLEGNGFYQTAAEITQNGFPQQCGGVSIYQNNINTSNAVLNHGNFVNTGNVKNVIGFNNSSGEVFSGSSVRQKCTRDETSPTMSEGYAGASSDGAFVTVMGAETGLNTANVVFPRCDSVRSETAESSCSSLSSGESQGDGTSIANAGLVLLPPPASTSVQPSSGQSSQPTVSGDVLVYDNNGVSVGVRTGQPVMLTMVPPQQPVQQLRQQTVTVPLGWKRLHTNGVIIYVSPSNTALSSLEQVKEYLQTHGTCKCGLECPLKCDAVFNFDPKVAGKPWTMTPDTNVGDLTKLCNHKRKLLAINSSLSSPQGKLSGLQRSPATLVTTGAQQMQTAYAGAAPLDPNKLRKDGSMKRKKRKMGSSYSGVSVSQLLAQREKMALAQQQMFNKEAIGNQQTQAQMWQAQSQQITSLQQANNPNNGAQFIRYQNPNSGMARIVQGPQMVVGTTMMVPQQGNTITTQQQQQMQQTIQQQQQNLQNQQIINQQHLQQTIQQNHQMIHQQSANQTQQQVNQNQVQQQQHIIGPNGQIITVQQQTNINGQNQMNMNAMNNMVNASGNVVIQGLQPQRIVLNNHTEDIHGPGRPLHHGNINVVNSNISSPHQQDAVQRIQNQQFYGQNISYQQGQIRSEDQVRLLQQQLDANKGIRQQFIPVSNANSNNTGAIFNNYRQDGIMQNSNQQMVVPSVSGTAVVIPQKTPPWQQNKINNMHQQNVLNQQHIIMQSQSVTNHQSNQNITGNVFERVPPLHHHTPPPPAWSDDTHRKKNKISKSMKKRPYNLLDHQHRQDGQIACPNIDVRQIPSERPVQQMAQGTQSPSAGPSFMEDPSGYLAQQTALLNSTISRQTGINNGLNYMCHSPGTPQNSSQQGTPPQPSTPPVGVPIPSNVIQPQSKQIQYSMRNPTNMVVNKNHIQQQHNQHNNQIENSIPLSVSAAQCQACIATSENMHMQQQYSNRVTASNVRELQSSSRPNSQPSTPSSLSTSQEDSPVTSSTYCEKFNNSHNPSPDTRPIQGGMISTSSGSPMEVFQPQSESSSTPSTPVPIQQRSNQMQNMYVSSTSSSFVMPGQNSPNVYSLNNSVNTSRELNISQTQTTVSVPMSESLLNSHSNIGLSYTTSIPTSMQNISKQQNQNNKSIDGYCPHPHAAGSPLGLQIPYQPRTVTTMASGRTVGSNTITSVLAGRAQTATVSVNTPAAMPSLNATQMSSMGQQSNPQMSQTISVSVSKSPLEMVQSVVSSIQVPHSQQGGVSTINIQSNQQMSPQQIVKHSPTQNLPSGHILVSSGGQLIMTNNGQGGIMPPPPPKLVNNNGGMPPISVSPLVTNVTASVTQVIPNVGMAQQVLGQQTVLVNALPAPFVIQPGVMTVDGMTVGQNVQLPQIVAGNVIQQQIQLDNADQNRMQSQNMSNRQPTLISPDSGKRKGKKRKMGSQTVASMLHVAAQQNSSVVMQQQQGFQPQSFQMAHSPQGVNTGPVLQALTIVPGKGGGPPQIVMNGQPGQSGPFSTQQLLTGSQPTQQINLLQPVNLLNGATGVVQNFPTIQQFIVPGLGGMVMATDGSTTATLLPDTSSVGMQLQLQNVNGQNVLTPVQNTNGTVFGTANGQSILTAGPAGMVIRSPGTPQGKIIQQQHSPGAQFLSPNGGQFLMNGTQFNSQLSPLVANVSPTQQVTVRPANSVQHTQHEFIQCGQMGQTLMVPCTPNGTQNIAVSSASNQQNTTFVQQNTTIVQQQTTMVSNNQPVEHFSNQNNGQSPQNVAGSTTTMNLDQNFIVNSSQQTNDRSNSQQQANLIQQSQQNISAALLLQRHSVSTQTAVGQSPAIGTTVSAGAGSPPDTTTHSPLAPGADTTTHEGTSPSPPGCNIQRERQSSHSMAMVHCISSSEPDASDLISISGTSDPSDWGRSSSAGSITPKSVDCTEFTLMSTNHHMVHGTVRKSLTPTYVESSISVVNNEASVKSQEAIISSQKAGAKRKHSDALLVMETRHMHTSLQDDDPDESHSEQPSSSPVTFSPGELVWGAAHGCPAWPGKLVDGPSSADGRVWVRWFGSDRSPPAAVDPATLQTLTQGLDAHHKARKKCRKSRKLNSQLENAIQEAMAELDRISEQQQQKLNQSAHSSKSMAHNIVNKKDTTGRLRSSQR